MINEFFDIVVRSMAKHDHKMKKVNF